MELNQAYTVGFFFGSLNGLLIYLFSKHIMPLDKPDYVIFFHYKRWYIKQLRYGLFYVTLKSEGLKYKYPLCWQTRKEAEDYLALIK